LINMATLGLLTFIFLAIPVGAVFGGTDSRALLKGGRFRDDGIASPD
jgi:hypothetical protein